MTDRSVTKPQSGPRLAQFNVSRLLAPASGTMP
jgi:hypothetical protein